MSPDKEQQPSTKNTNARKAEWVKVTRKGKAPDERAGGEQNGLSSAQIPRGQPDVEANEEVVSSPKDCNNVEDQSRNPKDFPYYLKDKEKHRGGAEERL